LKLLITGANGLFGSKLAKLALDKDIQVYSSDIQGLSTFGNFVKLDVVNKAKVNETFQTIKPDVVVHAASLTDVDRCELNKELAWNINVEGTKNVAEASQQTECFLIYISTDYVFSGEKGYYVESDSPEPLNYYGLTKLEAETVATQTMPQSDLFIGRPSVIYGSTPATGKINFALWLIETLRKGERVRIAKDQWNTPTLNTNLAEMTLEAIERRLSGVYHICGATRLSRFEFARKIADCFELDKSLIDKVSSTDFPWVAQRPVDSSLDTSLAQRILRCKPLTIDRALEKLKQELTEKQTSF